MKVHKGYNKIAVYFGVLGVGVIWAGLWVATLRVHLDIYGVRPLSSLGVNKASAGLFTASLVVSAMLFIGFGWFLYRKIQLNKAFIIVYTISHFGEIVTGVVRYGGKQKIIHTVAAFGWALTIPLAMYFFQKSLKLCFLSRSIKYFWWAQLAATILGIGAFTEIRRALPLCQLLIALPFHAWIIYTTVSIIQSKK